MKKFFKLISLLLTVLMVIGSLAVIFSVSAIAAETTGAESTEGENTDSTGDIGAADEIDKEAIDYVNQYFATPEEKLSTMDLACDKDGIRLYVDKISGEVAYVNTKTGEKLFTNPYDVAASTGNEATKYEILSQIIVTFTDNKGQERVFTSFEEAAERGQIKVENIKNGVRVEYAIGREQSKILVPRLISMDRFQEMIMDPLYEVFGDELYNPRSTDPAVFDVQKMLSYFIVYSVDELDMSKKDRANMENTFGGLYDDLVNSEAQYARALKKFPIIETMPVFVFDPDASESELSHAESIILKYCPEYTYEELEYDHILTEYKADDANPPVFRMALEYKVAEDGLSVRLPANGIRFNESLYTLDNIEVLPYMGAGNSAYKGYNFFPDGAGALFDFQALNSDQTRAVSGSVYGTDYAYHEIKGTYQKTIRYPVFGIVEEAVYHTYTKYNIDTLEKESVKTIAGNIVDVVEAFNKGEKVNFCKGQESALAGKYSDIIFGGNTAREETTVKRGFVCIIEEGDALAAITTYHAGALSDYNTIRMQFTPRPKDSYIISDSISVGSNDEWTVVSDRKYVGNYMMKYITLSSASSEKEAATTYDASWFGMAVAYRDYLTNKGIISKLSANELTSDIPLYIETFGTIETTEKILSIPVTVMAPLTTFEDVETIYDELSDMGIKNINFKLTGYANGGMQYTMPGNLKFERAVGGNKGFQALLDKANEINKQEDHNFGVFPDFDFVYTAQSGLFDGHSALKHNAKTIDDRYASKKVYSATQQKYDNFHEMAISPGYFADFYEKLKKNYADKYDGVIGISVSTLGNSLNSDFDEDEPYNREDSKEFTIEAFKHFNETYNGNVMTDGGNAYVWKYVNHMVGVSLDSSRYNFASESVPFIGVVLHGSIRFAGEPLNMEGDLRYAMLKAIENGASPYFILSYQNTQVLKEDKQLSKYYSIRYDIWSEDIASTYSELNAILGDVQDKYIIGHESITGATRVPDTNEFLGDIEEKYEDILNAQQNAAELLKKELKMAAYYARKNGRDAEKFTAEAVIKVLDLYTKQIQTINTSVVHGADYYDNLSAAYAALQDVEQYSTSMNADEKAMYDRMNKIYDIVVMYNIELEICKAAYDQNYTEFNKLIAGKDYNEYKTFVDRIYKNYSDGKIAKEQIDKTFATEVASQLLLDAIDAFVEEEITEAELFVAIDNYGVSFLDTKSIDTTLMNYLKGELDRSTLTAIVLEIYNKKYDAAFVEQKFAELDAKLAEYHAGTLSDSELNKAVDEWFAAQKPATEAQMKSAITALKEGSMNLRNFEDVVASYAFSKIDRATFEADIATLKLENEAYERAKANFELDPLIDLKDFDAAQIAFDEAKITFTNSIATFKEDLQDPITTASVFTDALKKYEAEKATYDKWVARKNIDKNDAENKFNAATVSRKEAIEAVVEFAFGTADRTALDANVNEYKVKADERIKYLAALDAFNAVIESGFGVKFEDCYNVYYTYYLSDRYSTFSKIIKDGKGTEFDQECFNTYYNSKAAVDKLKNNIKGMKVSTGLLDKYTSALAVYDYIMAHKDDFTESEITSATNLLITYKNTTISNLAAIESKTVKNIKDVYDTVLGYVDLAAAAIDVLALSENYTLEYNDENDRSFLNIKITENTPYLVKQAVERAQNAYYSIVEDGFIVVNEQRYETEYTYEGHKLYRVILPGASETVYSYGTFEEGYQYLTRNEDGSFSLYTEDLSFADGYVNGAEVWTNSEDAFGKEVYFTITGGKYTYYTKFSGVFVEKAPIKYGGSLFRTLDDGTEIFLDGDVYYSVNEDGTYTRYTYSKSIYGCYEEIAGNAEEGILGKNAEALAVVKALQENEKASDNLIYTKVLERVEINNLLNKDEKEEQVEIEESKYSTDNIVVVTYGNDDGSVYKSIILNYNNYSVKVEYQGEVYTIPAYYYVVVN